MEKVFISVFEALERLSKGLGKFVELEALMQAFELAPDGKGPFPAFVKLQHATAPLAGRFEVINDIGHDWDGDEFTIERLSCPWPLWQNGFLDPSFGECEIGLIRDARRRVEGWQIRVHGYFALAGNQAHLVGGGWHMEVDVLPIEIFAQNPNAASLKVRASSGEPRDWECLFRASDIDAYVKTLRDDAPVLRTASMSDGQNDRHCSTELEAGNAVNAFLIANPDAANGTSPKIAAKRWLKENCPDLSNQAIERISTLVNPKKGGGAPKSVARTKPTGG